MNYIGSKSSLLEFIEQSINKVVKEPVKSFCDVFAGTGAVGLYFKQKGYHIISNDLQYYSYVLNRHYIGNHKELTFDGLLDECNIKASAISERKFAVCSFLNNLPAVKGFIYNNYAMGGTKNSDFERQYFSDKNASRCDAIRIKIEEWYKAKKITNDEYYFLLTSLLEAIDKCANTASVYGAFLKKLKSSAQKDLLMFPAKLVLNSQEHEIYNCDANNLLKRVHTDILYLDPPYNARQYCANYHMLETIAKYDSPIISGKTGLRDYKEQKSLYCSKSSVKKAFADLIEEAQAKYIFLSYNNEGLLSLNEIKEIMSNKGEYGYFTQSYNRFKADSQRDYKADKTIEYLHYCIVKH